MSFCVTIILQTKFNESGCVMSRVEAIKNDLKEMIGQTVVIKADMGRNKIVEATGILANTYPGIFTVEVNFSSDVTGIVSYSYSDILCERVRVTPTA